MRRVNLSAFSGESTRSSSNFKMSMSRWQPVRLFGVGLFLVLTGKDVGCTRPSVRDSVGLRKKARWALMCGVAAPSIANAGESVGDVGLLPDVGLPPVASEGATSDDQMMYHEQRVQIAKRKCERGVQDCVIPRGWEGVMTPYMLPSSDVVAPIEPEKHKNAALPRYLYHYTRRGALAPIIQSGFLKSGHRNMHATGVHFTAFAAPTEVVEKSTGAASADAVLRIDTDALRRAGNYRIQKVSDGGHRGGFCVVAEDDFDDEESTSNELKNQTLQHARKAMQDNSHFVVTREADDEDGTRTGSAGTNTAASIDLGQLVDLDPDALRLYSVNSAEKARFLEALTQRDAHDFYLEDVTDEYVGALGDEDRAENNNIGLKDDYLWLQGLTKDADFCLGYTPPKACHEVDKIWKYLVGTATTTATCILKKHAVAEVEEKASMEKHTPTELNNFASFVRHTVGDDVAIDERRLARVWARRELLLQKRIELIVECRSVLECRRRGHPELCGHL